MPDDKLIGTNSDSLMEVVTVVEETIVESIVETFAPPELTCEIKLTNSRSTILACTIGNTILSAEDMLTWGWRLPFVVFRNHTPNVCVIILLDFLTAIGFFIISIYLASYFKRYRAIPKSRFLPCI